MDSGPWQRRVNEKVPSNRNDSVNWCETGQPWTGCTALGGETQHGRGSAAQRHPVQHSLVRCSVAQRAPGSVVQPTEVQFGWVPRCSGELCITLLCVSQCTPWACLATTKAGLGLGHQGHQLSKAPRSQPKTQFLGPGSLVPWRSLPEAMRLKSCCPEAPSLASPLPPTHPSAPVWGWDFIFQTQHGLFQLLSPQPPHNRASPSF